MSNTYRAVWGCMGQMRRKLLALAAAAALSATTIGPATAEWDETYFPNVELVNQDGVPLRFWDDLLRDKIVVVNFVYTECPDICGLSSARMAQVVDWLGERIGKDIFVYSISIIATCKARASTSAISLSCSRCSSYLCRVSSKLRVNFQSALKIDARAVISSPATDARSSAGMSR